MDQKAVMKSDLDLPVYDHSPAMRKEGRKIGFSRIGFRYEPQTFTAAYEKKYVQVKPYSSLKVETKIT